jgi:hypothetical protein
LRSQEKNHVTARLTIKKAYGWPFSPVEERLALNIKCVVNSQWGTGKSNYLFSLNFY